MSRHHEIEALFHAARDLPLNVDRHAWLESSVHDTAVRREVVALLAAHAALGQEESIPSDPPIPTARFGRYEAVALIGRGGMSAVFRACRIDGQFDQVVALKVLAGYLAGPEFVQRFQRERQLLASLNHHNITRLLDGGISSAGDPYLVTELVDGDAIDRVCDKLRLGVNDRLRLLLQVCDAVDYAHRHLIVHGDLKPANILVDTDGSVKLLDFGTASLMASEAAVTKTGLRTLTPRYASPEQLRGERVTVASDTFSLGIIAYELLTGSWPFGDPRSVLSELNRAVRDVPPTPLPQAVTSAHAEHCGKAVVQLQKTLAGDVSSVVMKALETDPERRYRSVDELADDIRRYLDAEPVRAKAQSFWYRTRCFARRRFWFVAAGSLSAAALLTATIVSYGYARRAQRESERAQLASERSQRIARFTTETLLSVSPGWIGPMSGHTGPITIDDLLDNAAVRVGKDLGSDPAAEAQIRGTLGTSWALLGNNEKAMPQLDRALALMPRNAPGLENDRARLFEWACNAASYQGDYTRARLLCAEAVAELTKARDPSPDLLFAAPYDLAYMSAKEGLAPAEVERLYQQSADAAAGHFGQRDLRYNIAMTRVGIARFDAGDLNAARQILEAVVSGIQGLPGPPVELVIAERALAAVYRVQGRPDSAEELARQALALLEKRPASFIDKDVIELEILLDEALEGHVERIVDQTDEVVRAAISKLPPGHIDRARPNVISARVLTLAGRCREAEPRLRESIKIYQTVLPLWPGLQAESLAALADSLACQGRGPEAQQAAEEALRLYREAYGSNAATHPAVTALTRAHAASEKPAPRQ